jgi:hypothetical protein
MALKVNIPPLDVSLILSARSQNKAKSSEGLSSAEHQFTSERLHEDKNDPGSSFCKESKIEEE